MSDLEQQLADHLRRRAAAAAPRFDLEGIEQSGSLVPLVDLDDRRPRRPRVRTIVGLAAAVVLLALVATLTLLDDDRTVDTAPANTDARESTTTEPPQILAFGPPFFRLDDLDTWTVEQGDGTPYELDFFLISGPPQTSVKLAIPDAATPEDALADIASKAPSLFVLSDSVDTTVGNMPATCMDVEPAEGQPGGTPLIQLREQGPATTIGSDQGAEVVLEEGAAGRVCVVDVEGDPLIVLIQAPPAEFAAFLEETQVLLDGVEFE